MRFFNIAGIHTAIDDSTYGGAAYAEYFSSVEVEGGGAAPDFIVRVTEDRALARIEPKYTAVSGKIGVNEEAFSFRASGFTFTVRHLFDEKNTPELIILWRPRLRDRIPLGGVITAKTLGVKGKKGALLEKTLTYSLFWAVFAMVLLRHGRAFVHAGIFTTEAGDPNTERAVAVTGCAGCGKTSTLLGVLGMDGTGYLGEDFGVLADDGMSYFIPKTVTVYEEDAAFGNSNIDGAVKSLGFGDRLLWELFRITGVNVRYKFAPEAVFPGRVSDRAKIGALVFAVKADCDEPRVTEADTDEISERIMRASFRELRTFYGILSNIRAVCDEETRKLYPSMHELEERYRKIVSEIAAGADAAFILETPFKVTPDRTIAAILGRIGYCPGKDL